MTLVSPWLFGNTKNGHLKMFSMFSYLFNPCPPHSGQETKQGSVSACAMGSRAVTLGSLLVLAAFRLCTEQCRNTRFKPSFSSTSALGLPVLWGFSPSQVPILRQKLACCNHHCRDFFFSCEGLS